MKNRIWKKILAVGVSLLAEAPMLVDGRKRFAAAGSRKEYGYSCLRCGMDRFLQKFQAVISVKCRVGWRHLRGEMKNQEDGK